MWDATLNLRRDEALYPGLRVLYVSSVLGTITIWHDGAVMRHWHSTDWDVLGWSVVKQKVLEAGLLLHDDEPGLPPEIDKAG